MGAGQFEDVLSASAGSSTLYRNRRKLSSLAIAAIFYLQSGGLIGCSMNSMGRRNFVPGLHTEVCVVPSKWSPSGSWSYLTGVITRSSDAQAMSALKQSMFGKRSANLFVSFLIESS